MVRYAKTKCHIKFERNRLTFDPLTSKKLKFVKGDFQRVLPVKVVDEIFKKIELDTYSD